MRTRGSDDYLVCVAIHDQVRVVGHNDDLTTQFRAPEAWYQLVIDRPRIEALFGLVDH
jgi:hypothetical protein